MSTDVLTPAPAGRDAIVVIEAPAASPAPAPPIDGARRRYRSMWLATAVSSLGDGLVVVAFPLLAATLTTDPRLIAGVVAAQRAPWLLALLTGALADRFDRRRFLTVVELIRSAALVAFAAVVALGQHGLLALYVAAFVLGTLETAFTAGAMAALPCLVPPDALARANGQLYAVQMAGEQLAGPAIGGAVFALGTGLPFVLDGASFVASALLLALAIPRRREPEAGGTSSAAVWESCVEGWRWFRASTSTRRLAGVVATFAFCQSMAFSLLVILCTRDLGLGPGGFGLFMALGAVGNVAGASAAGRLSADRDAASVLRAAGIVTGVAYGIIATAPNPSLAVVGLLVEAVAVAVGNVASVTWRQLLIPTEMLGRVGNIFRTCIFGAMPLGALAAGLLATATNVRVAIGTAAALQLAAAVVRLGVGHSVGPAGIEPATKGL